MSSVGRSPISGSIAGKSRGELSTLLREAQSRSAVVCDPRHSAVDQFLEILLCRRPDIRRFEDRPLLGFNLMKFLKPTPPDGDSTAAGSR